MSVSAAPAAAAKDAPGAGEAMVQRINAVRADHGLAALRRAPKLMHSTRSVARRLMRNDSFSHGAAFRSTGFRNTGEMLAFNPNWSLATGPAIRMWLGSAMHRGLMLSRSFRYVGANPVRGRFAGALRTIWVVHFGAH